MRSVERFFLYTECSSMGLLVSIDGADEAADIGLTDDVIQAAAESRLRAARLYVPDFKSVIPHSPVPYLHAHIHVVGPAIDVHLGFRKNLLDQISGEENYAQTWEKGSLGTHGGDSSLIMSTLSIALDRFIADYLRVNESACSP